MKYLYRRGDFAGALDLLLRRGIEAGVDAAKSDTGIGVYVRLKPALERGLQDRSVPFDKQTARAVARGQLDEDYASHLLRQLAGNPTLAGSVMKNALQKLLAANRLPESANLS